MARKTDVLLERWRKREELKRRKAKQMAQTTSTQDIINLLNKGILTHAQAASLMGATSYGIASYSSSATSSTTPYAAQMNPQTQPKGRRYAKEGEKIRIINNTCGHPLRMGEEIFAETVDSGGNVLINSRGFYIANTDYEVVVAGGSGYTPPPTKIFDLKKLEALVIADDTKNEIMAVLKQHKNSKKLFDEWGLGEVIEYGKGMGFMFYGPPGTGKTWAATCIAKALGKELLVIGAAEIQTSEPGGANRNIQNAFKTAKEQDKILFMDECDSLITNRSDVGMILGSEINTLLTEIEKSEGVTILATNRIDTLDPALERRISLIVEFPEPDFKQRESIWSKMLPKKMPLGDDVTPTKLAEYKLTGGQIKNVVLQAARLALGEEAKKVEGHHFHSAVERINKSKALMGSRSRYIQYHGAPPKQDYSVDVVKDTSSSPSPI